MAENYEQVGTMINYNGTIIYTTHYIPKLNSEDKQNVKHNIEETLYNIFSKYYKVSV